MKKTFLNLFITLFTCSVCTYGQAGSLDSTFGVNGKSEYQINGSDMDKAIVQQNGKFIIAGQITSNNTLKMSFARFNADGLIDSTFGDNGIVSFLVGDGENLVTSLAIQDSNKIVFGGNCIINQNYVAVLGRLNPDGSLDSTFADDGIKLSMSVGVNDIAIRPNDGKIIVLTNEIEGSNYITAFERYNSNGSIDSSFGTNGRVIDLNDGLLGSMAKMKLQADNKIIGINEYGLSPHPYIALARFNENGTPDSTYGVDGIAVDDYGTNANAFGLAIALQADGKTLITGSYGIQNSGQPNKVLVARYNTDGSPDITFGNNGKAFLGIGTGDQGNTITIQPSDGKIIVCGSSNFQQQSKRFVVCRFEANGDPDNEFGGSGYVITDFVDQYHNNLGYSAFVLPDGKILAGGVSVKMSNVWNIFARYISCGISVTSQPADETAHLGGAADFTVGSTSSSANYQWQTLSNNSWEDLNNGGQYSGTQTATLHVANITMANNLQKFRGIALSGVCSDTSSAATLTVDSTTGINEVAVAAGIKIYPNPIKSPMNIRIGNPNYRQGSIKVINSLGRNIHTVILNGKEEIEIDTKSWPSGVYSLEIIPEKGLPATLRAVKI